RGHAAVAARQDALEQAALDVVLLDAHRLDAATASHVLPRPLQVVARLHAVPLVGRVRLGDEVRYRGGDLEVAATHLLADLGDVLGHVDDAVEIDLAFPRQADEEIELHLLPAV